MKYATNDSPFAFTQYKNWSLTQEQFSQLQDCISGANMPLDGNTESLDGWVKDRNNYLISCETDEGYQPYGWCRFGKFEENDCTEWWYETTSGTILTVAVDVDSEVFYEVSLPLDRAEPERIHYREIQYVLEGRTVEQQKNWYNCLYQPESRKFYEEFAAFHNKHLTKHGFKPYPLKWEEYSALCTLKSVARVTVFNDGHIFSGDIELIRSRLREATQEWDNLFPQGIVSVVFYATKEGCDYEPSMTPLVFPFEDFEIQEAITYLDGELYGSQSDSQHQPDKLIETIADAQEFVASKYQQHSTDTVFKPYTKKSKLNAVSFEDSEGFETIVEIPCTPNSLELALLLAWGE